MIQRKQTLFLIIAIVCLVFTYKLPMFIGTHNQAKETAFPFAIELTHTINTTIIIMGFIVSVFLFKKRKIQMLVSSFMLLNYFVYYYIIYKQQLSLFTTGSLTIYAIFYFAIPVFVIMAIMGIYKDEKLIKSVNSSRLRD